MAGYHDEQENINTAKHIWHSGGKWVAAVLVAGALGYVGYVAYKGRVHQGSAQAAQLAAQVKGDAAKLAALQQQFPKDTATTQASLQTAAALFQAGKLDDAAKAYLWVVANDKKPVFQAAEMQNLANVYIQQKKYDDALKTLAMPVSEPYQPLINETKGDVFAAQGKAKEAGEAYKLALDKLPENSGNRQFIRMKMSQL